MKKKKIILNNKKNINEDLLGFPHVDRAHNMEEGANP